MSGIIVSGDTSGSVTLSAPAVAGTVTVTLPSTTGTMLTTASATGISGSAISSGTVPEAYGGTGTSTGYYGFKNRIINGAMSIWQRGTSISVGSASYTYTADRFKTYSINSATTVSQNTSVPSGFQYSLKLQRPNANTGTSGLSSVQMIESSNCFDLAGQSVTLSFWAKAGANYSGGTLTVQGLSGTVADQTGDPYNWTGLSAFINAGQAITTTWTRYSFTATVSASALEIATAIIFTPTGTAGADDSIYITGVQLEKGSTATSFDYRPYGTELALCQRYYYRITTSQSYSYYCSGGTNSTTTAYFTKQNPVPMRAVPTTSDFSAAATFRFNVAGFSTITAIGVDVPDVNTCSMVVTGTGFTTQQPAQLGNQISATSFIGFGAEL